MNIKIICPCCHGKGYLPGKLITRKRKDFYYRHFEADLCEGCSGGGYQYYYPLPRGNTIISNPLLPNPFLPNW